MYRNEITVGAATYTDDNLYGGISYRCDFCSGEQIILGETPCKEISFTLDTKLNEGTEILYTYKGNDVGYFYIDEVKRDTSNTSLYKHVAYDCVKFLDKDAYTWTSSLSRDTKYTINGLFTSMESAVGVDFVLSDELVNTDQQIYVTWPEQGLTFRSIVGYLSSACGGYAISSEDKINILPLDPESNGVVSIDNNSWTKRTISEVPTPAIDQLVIMAVEGDVGYKFPEQDGDNVMIMMGNPVFYNDDMETATQNIYDVVSGISNYVPMTIDLFDPIFNQLPFIINTTKNGVTTNSIVTNISWDLSGCKLESKGLSNRSKVTQYIDPSELKNQARYNKLTRDLNQTQSEIATLDGRITTVTQTADEVSVYVKAEAHTFEQDAEPTNPVKYDMWKDTSFEPPEYFRWDGLQWNAISEEEYKNTSMINSMTSSLDGVVFMNNLTDGTTTISGNNIKTGVISAQYIEAPVISADDIKAGKLWAKTGAGIGLMDLFTLWAKYNNQVYQVGSLGAYKTDDGQFVELDIGSNAGMSLSERNGGTNVYIWSGNSSISLQDNGYIAIDGQTTGNDAYKFAIDGRMSYLGYTYGTAEPETIPSPHIGQLYFKI